MKKKKEGEKSDGGSSHPNDTKILRKDSTDFISLHSALFPFLRSMSGR